jgi:hypothetical protein
MVVPLVSQSVSISCYKVGRYCEHKFLQLTAPRAGAGDVELFFELLFSLCLFLCDKVIILGDISRYFRYLKNSVSKTNSLQKFLDLTKFNQHHSRV